MKQSDLSEPAKISKETNGYSLVFDRVFPFGIDGIWQTISEPEKIRFWFTDLEFEMSAGSPLIIRFRDEALTINHGEVVAVEQGRYLAWTWEGELAEWTLESISENETRLQFKYSKMAPEYVVKTAAVFHILLKRLARTLEGDSTIYAFGNEGFTPEMQRLQTWYNAEAVRAFPELCQGKYIRIVKDFPCDAASLWQAITEKDKMKQWYFELSDFQPVPGFEFSFAGQGHKGEQYLHLCEVLQAEPLNLLQYTWTYKGHVGFSIVSFFISATDGGCRLIFSHHGLDSFPADSPDFAFESFEGGWNYILHTALAAYLISK